jgi:hypothetical protein
MYMAAVALICLGVTIWCLQRKHYFRGSGMLLAAVWFEYLLLITYSRASYLSFLAGTLLLARSRPKWPAWVAIGTFFAIGFIIPSGGARMASIADQKDIAVRNRLLLWQSTSALIVDNWPAGYSATPFNEVHKTWYGADSMKDALYRTPVNGFLYCGARHGLPAMAVLVATGSFICMQLIYNGWQARNVFWSTAGGLALVYIFGNILSTQLDLLPWTALMLGLLGSSIWTTMRHWNTYRKQALFLGAASLLTATVVALAVVMAGKRFKENRGFAFSPRGAWTGGSAYELVEISPKRSLPIEVLSQGAILCLADSLRGACLRQVMADFVQKGWDAFYAKVPYCSYSELERVANIIRAIQLHNGKETRPLYILAAGEAAQIAFVASCSSQEIEGVVAIDMIYDWPYAGLSPRDNIADFKAKLFLLGFGTNEHQSQGEHEFIKQCRAKGVDLQINKLPLSHGDKPEDKDDLVYMITNWLEHL